MRSVCRLVTALVAALTLGGATAAGQASAPVSVERLLSADVLVAPGGSLTSDERSRLEAAATDLARTDANGESFPSKFVAVPRVADAADLDAAAAKLRAAAITKLGDANRLDGVFLIAPNAVGISANAFASEINDALTAERATLMRDRVAGVIALAERFRALDASNALPGEVVTTSRSRSRTPLVWGGGVLLVAILAAGAALARRRANAAARELEQAQEDRARAADDGAPPPDLRQ